MIFNETGAGGVIGNTTPGAVRPNAAAAMGSKTSMAAANAAPQAGFNRAPVGNDLTFWHCRGEGPCRSISS